MICLWTPTRADMLLQPVLDNVVSPVLAQMDCGKYPKLYCSYTCHIRMADHVSSYCRPGGSVVKNLPANAGDTGDSGLIPVSGRSPEGGTGYPLQYTCLESPVDREACWARVMGSQSWTWLSDWPHVHSLTGLLDLPTRLNNCREKILEPGFLNWCKVE